MQQKLSISIGQYSEQGRKQQNQDFHGVMIPGEPQLTNKGIVVAIADGVSSCNDGREAAESCVAGFLSDYYSTPDSWSTRKSVHRILTAINNWLFSRGQPNAAGSGGLITTLTALVLKSTTGHLFHVGDSRLYRLQKDGLECLTTDHRRWIAENDYLNRAMGIDAHLEIDYRKIVLECGDIFVLTTDGVHDFVADRDIKRILHEHADPNQAAEHIVRLAYEQGSGDNITCQVLRIETLPVQTTNEAIDALTRLPFPPDLQAGMVLDGLRIDQEIHASNRTQIYKATELDSGRTVAVKTPSVNFEDDPAYIENFIREEWVGKRIRHSRVLKVVTTSQPRQFLYYVTEYIDGQTLRQWMDQHSRPEIKEARLIVEQIATGLRAFHRLEMLHQDIKPENILVDGNGKITIIDFGSTKIAGIAEIDSPVERISLLGTRNYTAPEYLLGQPGSNRSDIFSLGTIAYELMTGKLPYGHALERGASPRQIERLKYHPASLHNPLIPQWMDRALHKAVAPQPARRYAHLSEFIHDLSHPNPELETDQNAPLMVRYPVGFWRTTALILLAANLILLYFLLK